MRSVPVRHPAHTRRRDQGTTVSKITCEDVATVALEFENGSYGQSERRRPERG
ncbi:hypothetical protein [Halostagnicola bangensis]